MPGAIVANNALVDLGQAGDRPEAQGRQPWHLTENMFVVFSNATAAGLRMDGTLVRNSPLRGAGTAGKDIGVSFEELQRLFRAEAPTP
jgi:hypothetical protein